MELGSEEYGQVKRLKYGNKQGLTGMSSVVCRVWSKVHFILRPGNGTLNANCQAGTRQGIIFVLDVSNTARNCGLDTKILSSEARLKNAYMASPLGTD